MTQASDGNRLNLPVGKRDHIQGALNTRIVLVKYGDYQSPACGQAHLVVKQMQRQLGEQLCFVFRHFPLTQLHPQAQKAAEAAEVAAAQGKFWQMHDTLFEHQQALNNGYLVEYALEIGLDIPKFLQDMSGYIYAQRVQEDYNSGVSSGVSSTPTFFINSILYQGAWNLESLIAAIEAAS